jgi:tRNA A37 N6-isopentenylltransferase MiaA
MVEEIYKMKNELLQQAKKELAERGPERIDVNRMDKMIDMVKDLADAEKSCWEASYYRKVTEAMEGSAKQHEVVEPQSMRQGYDVPKQGDLITQLGEEFRNLSQRIGCI